ncbi:unnamed protein product [Trichobilharzia regenti]|nr:unnamed protein product [Trichobilharzia regenti]
MSNSDDDFERLLEIDDELKFESIQPSVVDLDTDEDSQKINPPKILKTVNAEHMKDSSQDNVPSCSYSHSSSHLLKRIPLDGDYVSVTFSNGERFYLTMDDSDSGDFFHKVKNHKSKLISTLVEEKECGLNFKHLWTTKYSPSSYLDLISDETTNRTLLRWLKAWDHYVFGTPAAKPQINSHVNPGSFTNKPDDLESMAGEINPRDGLPRYRLVLLAGPPGLGKTTLAHLLAEHAGYQVVEINASDDRSVSVLRDRLTAIVSSSTSLNTSKRTNFGQQNYLKPCCLIMDEIDGAMPAAVEILASAAKNTLPTTSDRQVRSKKSNPPLVLRRPVICICNDLYSPSVRALRAPGVPCLTLRIPIVDLGCLISRLDIITKAEGLSVDKMTLTHLVEMSDRDIRSCLNTLQVGESIFFQ